MGRTTELIKRLSRQVSSYSARHITIHGEPLLQHKQFVSNSLTSTALPFTSEVTQNLLHRGLRTPEISKGFIATGNKTDIYYAKAHTTVDSVYVSCTADPATALKFCGSWVAMAAKVALAQPAAGCVTTFNHPMLSCEPAQAVRHTQQHCQIVLDEEKDSHLIDPDKEQEIAGIAYNGGSIIDIERDLVCATPVPNGDVYANTRYIPRPWSVRLISAEEKFAQIYYDMQPGINSDDMIIRMEDALQAVEYLKRCTEEFLRPINLSTEAGLRVFCELPNTLIISSLSELKQQIELLRHLAKVYASNTKPAQISVPRSTLFPAYDTLIQSSHIDDNNPNNDSPPTKAP